MHSMDQMIQAVHLRFVPLKFYRCDSLPSPKNDETDPRSRISTWINTFKSDGILTKAYRHEDPKHFDKIIQRFPYYVAAHIGYKADTPEMTFNKKESAFLSWSLENQESALHFLDRTKARKFQECRVFEADHFLFELSGFELTPLDKMKPYFPFGHEGLYEFPYSWSFQNFQHILDEEALRLKTGDPTAMGTVILLEAIRRANADHTRKGFGILVDAVTFLTKNRSLAIPQELLDEAIRRASAAAEWLLFPIESSESISGISGRFCPNPYLKILKWLRRAD